MKKSIFNIILIISISFNHALSQNEIDALRYSQQNIYGTAKFSSMSGSFGSLGGDFSSLSYNPAGIGLYQNSEFTITPSFSLTESTSSLQNNQFTRNKIGGGFSNLGIIFRGNNQDNKWKRINIGVGWNKLSDYNNRYYTESQNNTNSLADFLLEEADGISINNLNQFRSSLAFWTDLIDLSNNSTYIDSLDDGTINEWYAFDNGSYISHVNSLANKIKSQDQISSGDMGEFVITLGSSYEENIYLGITLGFPTIKYNSRATYMESNFDDTTYNLKEFVYKENISSIGDGVNLKIGSIIRINENTKIGLSIHSPSYISMQEEYTTSIETRWENGDSYTEISPLGYFEYDIITPWKTIASISRIFNNKFLINAEIEQTDYSFTKMYSDYYAFDEENNAISENYTLSTNMRIGAEAKLNPFNIRIGYGLYGSPYKNQEENTSENYSVGIGANFGSIFYDISYTMSEKISNYAMYSSENNEVSNMENRTDYLLFTLGFRY